MVSWMRARQSDWKADVIATQVVQLLGFQPGGSDFNILHPHCKI